MNQRLSRLLCLSAAIPALFFSTIAYGEKVAAPEPVEAVRAVVVIPPPPPPPVLSNDDNGMADVEQDVQGLSPRTRDLILTIIEGFRHAGANSDEDGPGFMEHLVSITIIVLSLGFPPIILSIVLFFGYKKERLRYNTMIHLAEKGIDVSSLDFEPEARRRAALADFRKGTLYLAFGGGLALFFHLAGWSAGVGLGAIPAFIGVAHLFIHFTRGSGSLK
jgi:hypothetical protein